MSSPWRILARHPMAMQAWFHRVVAVTFAFPAEVLRPLVPPALELDEVEGQAFVAVALVWTEGMRPSGWPAFLGRDFFLSGYRIFVRLQEPGGRRLRGLYILRTETDQALMVRLGNVMAHYGYRQVQVVVEEHAERVRLTTRRPDGEATLQLAWRSPAEAPPLPAGSPFADWKGARRFAGPMPFTFSLEDPRTVVVVEGQRQHWEPHPVALEEWDVRLFQEEAFAGTAPRVASAFAVEKVPYRWQRGRVVRLGGKA